MNSNNDIIDLDIFNYNKKELMSFFRLNDNYTYDELNQSANYITNNILQSIYDSEYKDKIIHFITVAKQTLTYNSQIKDNTQNNYNDPNTNNININNNNTNNNNTNNNNTNNNNNNNNNTNSNNNIGKILNPLSNHQTLERQSIPNNVINGYGVNRYITNYIFDTKYRDDFYSTIPTKCTFTLPIILKNVVSITLSALQFPNTFFTFNNDYQTNELYISEDNGKDGIVILPEGNYTSSSFPGQLEKVINEQIVGEYIPEGPNRFTVSISTYTGFTTISNSVNNFTMNIIKKTTNGVCSNYIPPAKYTPVDDKKQISSSTLFQTMGYQIGYRNIAYTGSKSYTSESQFNSKYADYIYFSLNEYNSSSINTVTYGVLPNSLVDKHILAVVPITSPAFTNTFDNGANYIYKKRTYLGPIKINKISIEFINRVGNIINIHNNDFAFCLEIESIYDNIKYTNKI